MLEFWIDPQAPTRQRDLPDDHKFFFHSPADFARRSRPDRAGHGPKPVAHMGAALPPVATPSAPVRSGIRRRRVSVTPRGHPSSSLARAVLRDNRSHLRCADDPLFPVTPRKRLRRLSLGGRSEAKGLKGATETNKGITCPPPMTPSLHRMSRRAPERSQRHGDRRFVQDGRACWPLPEGRTISHSQFPGAVSSTRRGSDHSNPFAHVHPSADNFAAISAGSDRNDDIVGLQRFRAAGSPRPGCGGLFLSVPARTCAFIQWLPKKWVSEMPQGRAGG